MEEIITLIEVEYNIKNIKFMATYSDHSGPDHEIYDMFNYVEGECK
jgi:hypothetical protein